MYQAGGGFGKDEIALLSGIELLGLRIMRVIRCLAIVGLCVFALGLRLPASATSIKYLGQSCFLITANNGLRIILDPFRAGDVIRYRTLPTKADVVFVSHEHFDHNATDRVNGKPVIVGPMSGRDIQELSVRTRKGILRYRNFPSWHDEEHGRQRGPNTVRAITVDGVKICHFGDLGYGLPIAQSSDIHADIWLIPVGGKVTIDAARATKLIADTPKSNQPAVIIPMHYKTPMVDLPLNLVDKFLEGKKNVEKLKGNTFVFSKDKLPKTQKIVVLTP